MHSLKPGLASFLLASQVAFLVACGTNEGGVTPEPEPQTQPGCGPQAALILVLDGMMQAFCGCDEAAASPARAGTSIVCSAPAPLTVQFLVPGVPTSSILKHQILSTGTPSFPSGPLLDPAGATPIRAHAVVINQPGQYQFSDVYFPGVGGTLSIR